MQSTELGSKWRSINWSEVFARKCEADHIFMRSGLIRKDLILQHAFHHMPESYIVKDFQGLLEVMERLHASEDTTIMMSPSFWVLKLSDASNAYGIHFFSFQKDVGSTWGNKEAIMQSFGQERGIRILQRYIQPPPILGGRKFHIRALVLVVGNMDVCLYKDMRVLISPEPLSWGNTLDLHQHITNRSFNLRHFAYKESQCNVSLSSCKELLPYDIPNQVNAICRDVFISLSRKRSKFFTLPNCYELFGLDFMVNQEGKVFLLEANPDPSLDMFGATYRQIVGSTSPLQELPLDRFSLVYSLRKHRAFQVLLEKM